MSVANKQTALAFLRAMDAGDAAAADRCLAPDAVAHTRGFAQVSGLRNREMLLATVSAFKEVVPTGFRAKILHAVAEGNMVVLEFEGNAVLSNGEPYCNQYAFIFTFEHGRIKQINEYCCTLLADRTILPVLMEKNREVAHGSQAAAGSA